VRRQEALREFFTKVLVVDAETAEIGACKMEHEIPPEIVERFIQFVDLVEVCPRAGSKAYQEAVGETKHPAMPAGNSGEAASEMPVDENAQTHLRIVTPRAQTMLRRSYSYNDGVNFTAERWPPWRQGLEYDAGMFFICYQRDPRNGFIALYDRMSKYDAMLNQFWTHEGGGLFAYPAAPSQASTSDSSYSKD